MRRGDTDDGRENKIMLDHLPSQKGLHILLFVLCVQLPRRKSVIKCNVIPISHFKMAWSFEVAHSAKWTLQSPVYFP